LPSDLARLDLLHKWDCPEIEELLAQHHRHQSTGLGWALTRPADPVTVQDNANPDSMESGLGHLRLSGEQAGTEPTAQRRTINTKPARRAEPCCRR